MNARLHCSRQSHRTAAPQVKSMRSTYRIVPKGWNAVQGWFKRVDRDRDVRDRERVDRGSAISLLLHPTVLYLDLEFASPTFRGPSRRLLLRHSFPLSLKKCLFSPASPSLPSCGEFRPLRLMDVMSDVLTLPSPLPPPPSANSAKFTSLPLSLRSTLSRGPFLPPPSVVRLPLPYIFITLAPPAARRRRRWLQRSCKFDRQGVMYVDLFEAEIHGGFDKRPTLIRFVWPAVHAHDPSLLTS